MKAYQRSALEQLPPLHGGAESMQDAIIHPHSSFVLALSLRGIRPRRLTAEDNFSHGTVAS